MSKVGDFASYGSDPRRIEYAGANTDGLSVDYKAKYAAQQQVIKDNYKTFDVPYNGTDNDNYADGEGFCCNDGSMEAAVARTKAQARAVARSFKAPDNYENLQFFYHPDHLGSSSFITNLDGEVVQHIEYVPFGEVFIEERNSVWNTPYLFNAKEFDEETGMYYYGARYYDPRLSLWMSTDPMETITPNYSTYCYTVNNPINAIDLDGNSTHTDKKGNVIAVYEDGYLGIFSHSNDVIKKGGHLANDMESLVGYTLFEQSFKPGDHISYGSFRAKEWIDAFEANQEQLIALSPLNIVRKGYYAINARNRCAYDPKSYLPGGVGGGSQISEGIYISNRDLGNYAAGAFARINGYDKQKYLAETGAFQLSGNNLTDFLRRYDHYMNKAYRYPKLNDLRTYGEEYRSNYFIRLGYENIRTLENFNKYFKRIFYEDKRNYKCNR